jgi:hypothetical protein
MEQKNNVVEIYAKKLCQYQRPVFCKERGKDEYYHLKTVIGRDKHCLSGNDCEYRDKFCPIATQVMLAVEGDPIPYKLWEKASNKYLVVPKF